MDPVEEIKSKIDVVDLVSSYVELKKAGRNYRGLCPFHSEKTPSFMVSPELQIFKCFGCGESGDIYSFYQKIEGVEFPQALESLAERAGVKLPKRAAADPNREKKKTIYEINHLATQYYSYILTKHKVGEDALKYVKDKRGLTAKTIENFQLGYAPDSWDSLYKFLQKKKYTDEQMSFSGLFVPSKRGKGFVDKFRGRIIFPLVGAGTKIVGFTGRAFGDFNPKYLNSPETLVFNKSSFIYGLDKAKVALKQQGAVFCEGSVDVITAQQSGIENVVAPLGTSLTPGQLRVLKRYTNDVTFAFDSDTAGDAATKRAIELAENQGFNVSIGLIPEKYQDLDELIKADKDLAKNILKNTVPVFDFYLASALKRHNPKSSIGKRKIMDELVPVFSKISDPVTKDHYIKKISEEVDVTESVVADLLNSAKSAPGYQKELVKDTAVSPALKKTTPEEYILALLLKAELDTAQTVLYKLGQKDFTNQDLSEIFTDLKKYLLGRKRKFQIQHFIKRFDEDLKTIVNDLYLWDLEEVKNKEGLFERELDKSFDQIKKNTAKRELKELSSEIKKAEMAGDTEKLEELTQEFQEVSEKLL